MTTGQPTRRVQLVSAEFGDEVSRRTVTKSLQSKLNEDEDVKVNSSLIPWISGDEGNISLTTQEQQQAKDKAAYDCFGPQNEDCVRKRQNDIMNTMLEEKKKKSQSSANTIKGRRLTIKVLDGGATKTYTIPDGQILSPKQMGITFAPRVADPGQFKEEQPSWTDKIPSVWTIVKTILMYGGIILASFLYIVSILTTWQAFRKADYNLVISSIPTAIAVFIPYSGFFITAGFFIVTRYFVNIKNTLPKT